MHTHIIRYVVGSPTHPNIIASAAQDGAICIWDIHHKNNQVEANNTQASTSTSSLPLIKIPQAHSAPVYKVMFVPPSTSEIKKDDDDDDGASYLVSTSQDPTIALHKINLDTNTFEFIERFGGFDTFGGGIRGLSVISRKFVLCGCDDGQVRLWNLFSSSSSSSSNEKQNEVENENHENNNNNIDETKHSGWCRTVALSFDEKYAISGSDDSKIIIWDIIPPTQQQEQQENKNNNYRLKSKYLLANHHKYYIRSVATVPPRSDHHHHHQDDPNDKSASSYYPLAVSAGDDATLKVWSLPKGVCLRTFVGHKATSLHLPWARTLAVAPNGFFCVSGAYDRSVRVWDLKSVVQDYFLTCDHDDDDESQKQQASSPSSLSEKEKSVKEEEEKTSFVVSKELLHCFDDHPNWVRSVAITNDSRFILSGSYDTTMRIWDLQEPKNSVLLDQQQPSTENSRHLVAVCDCHDDIIMHVSATSDSSFALSASTDLTVKVWKIPKRNGEENENNNNHNNNSIVVRSPYNSFGSTKLILSLCFSKCGNFVICGTADYLVKVFSINNEVSDSSALTTLSSHQGWVRHVDSFFHKNTTQLFIVSGSSDNTVKIWNFSNILSKNKNPTINNFSTPHLSIDHPLQIISLFVVDDQDPDSNYDLTSFTILTGCGDQKIRKYQINIDCGGVVFSGKNVTTDYYQYSCLLLQEYIGHTGWVRGVTVSKDRKFVTSSSGDETVRVWDYESGKCLHVLNGHVHIIPGLCSMNYFLENNNNNNDDESSNNSKKHFSLSASYDKTVRLWDLENGGKPKHAFVGHKNWVRCVQFHSNLVVTKSGENNNNDSNFLSCWSYGGVLGEDVIIGNSNQNNNNSNENVQKQPCVISCSYDKTVRVWPFESKFVVEDGEFKNEEKEEQEAKKKSKNAIFADIDSIQHETEHLLEQRLLKENNNNNNNSLASKNANEETSQILAPSNDKNNEKSKFHPGAVLAVAVSPEGRRIVSGCDDGKVRMWYV